MNALLLKQNRRKKAAARVRKIFMLSCLFIAALQQVKAQFDDAKPYTMAVGARYPYAISSRVNHGFDALETFIAFSPNFTRLTCLYELNKQLSDGLSAFAGAGGHITVWKTAWKTKHNYYETDIAMGVDAIIGIDYKVENLPLDISIDWQPYVNLYGYKQLNVVNAGINLRFAF